MHCRDSVLVYHRFSSLEGHATMVVLPATCYVFRVFLIHGAKNLYSKEHKCVINLALLTSIVYDLGAMVTLRWGIFFHFTSYK